MAKRGSLLSAMVFIFVGLGSAHGDESQWENMLKAGYLRHPIFHFGGNLAYARSLNSNTENGFGGAIQAELQFFTRFSLGAEYDFKVYMGSGGNSLVGAIDIFGRITPFQEGLTSYYLIGGLGLNSLISANNPRFPGDYHAFVGVGALIDLKDKWSLDLGLSYNYYNPQSNPLSSVSAHGGLSYALQL